MTRWCRRCGAKRGAFERYGRALRNYVLRGQPGNLRRAWAIGRQAVDSEVGLLGVLDTHERTLAALVGRSRTARLAQQLDAAACFLRESLGPFDLVCARSQETKAALRRMNGMLEEEARRVARAVHDETGTIFATVYLDLDELARQSPESARERIRHIAARLDEVREQLRHLSHEVYPTILDQLGLVPAIKYLAEGIGRRTGLAVAVEADGLRVPSRAAATAVYRVVQEALGNVTRHAQARQAVVRLWKDDGRLNCLIRDDGTGFDPAVVRGCGGGLGLAGMEERVGALGGEFQLASARGQGTAIRISLPQRRE